MYMIQLWQWRFPCIYYNSYIRDIQDIQEWCASFIYLAYFALVLCYLRFRFITRSAINGNDAVPRKRYECHTSMEITRPDKSFETRTVLQHYESLRNWPYTRQTRFCNNKTITPIVSTSNVDLVIYSERSYYCYTRSINSSPDPDVS